MSSLDDGSALNPELSTKPPEPNVSVGLLTGADDPKAVPVFVDPKGFEVAVPVFVDPKGFEAAVPVLGEPKGFEEGAWEPNILPPLAGAPAAAVAKPPLDANAANPDEAGAVLAELEEAAPKAVTGLASPLD